MNIGAFTSTHTIRLYELCSQYKTVGEREIRLEELKDWLQVADKYDRYNNFNQRVLEPSIAEINAKSDLFIEVEPIKRGRSIHALHFTIKPKQAVQSSEKIANKRPKFPHKNKYGQFVKLDNTNPKNSSHEYGLWAKDCLKILEDFYQNIEDVPPEDLRFYWIFLAINASNKSKLGTKKIFIDELKNRGYKLVNCELAKID